MHQPPLIVLSFEGLSPAAIGCFGSSWNQTPVIDSIAGTGCTWDRCIAASDDPDHVFHQLVEQLIGGRERSSATIELQTDVPSVIDGTNDRFFDRIDLVVSDPVTEQETPQADIIDTHLGRLFASTISRASQGPAWDVLWIHSGFLTRRWDAPREDCAEEVAPSEPPDSESTDSAGDQGAVEGDFIELPPPVFDSVKPPSLQLQGDEHPDLVTSWMRTYGCQVQLLDLLIGALLDSLTNADRRFVIAGTSGFRLGQAGWIGHGVGPLRSRDVHVPIVCSGSGPVRFSRLTSLEAAASAIGQCINEAELVEPWLQKTDDQHLVVKSARSAKNLTTSDWFYVRDDDTTEHLFSKPDDIDDFNDVARVRPDVVADLESLDLESR